MRISVCLQFTKYGLVFIKHVVTTNKFGKGVLLFIRRARRKRNPIYDKFYQDMPKIFFVFKMNKIKTIISETSTKMKIFKSNGSFCDFYPILPKTSFIHKMIKNTANT